jgi:PAS domain S-box-containing protein
MTPNSISKNSALSQIAYLWKAILNSGLRPRINSLERNRIKVVNGLSFLIMLISSFFLGVFLLFDVNNWNHLLLVYPLYIGILFINSKRKYNLARFTFFWGSLILLTAWCLFNRRIGAEYSLIALGCSTAIIYEKKLSVYVSLFFTMVAFISYKMLDMILPFLPDPTIDYSVLPIMILLASGAVVFMEIIIFRDLVYHYYYKLNNKTELLQSAMKEKLEAEEEMVSMNEALKASNKELYELNNQLDWIVEQKNSELQSYLDAINIHVYSAVTDKDGRILKVNEPLENITGYSQEELIGEDFSVINSGYHPTTFFQNLYETINEGNTWRGEVKNKAKDGSFFWLDMVVLPLRNKNGLSQYYLMLGLPVTERKKLDEERANSEKILESIAFQTSHDIRGPLKRIIGLTHLLEMDMVKKEEIEAVVRQLVESSKDLDMATSGLSNFVYERQNYTSDNPVS